MKKWDYIIIIFLILLSFTPYLIPTPKVEDGAIIYAEVYMDDALVDKFSVEDPKKLNQKFVYTGTKGTNTLMLTTEGVSVTEADCPDKICINSGSIKDPNRVIACLPNNFFVKIVSDTEIELDKDDVDFISE